MKFGPSYTQFFDGKRRSEAFNSQSYYDLSLTTEFPLIKVYGKQVSGFLKAMIFNVFNHQQNITWNVGWKPITVADGLDAPWEEVDGFGSVNSAGLWGDARSMNFSAGVRF